MGSVDVEAFESGDEPADRWRLFSERSISSVLADRLMFITEEVILSGRC